MNEVYVIQFVEKMLIAKARTLFNPRKFSYILCYIYLSENYI